MEMSQYSILLRCRKYAMISSRCIQTLTIERCKRSAFVDRDDYNETSNITCPLPGCSYTWCKFCNRGIKIKGPKHSCDGSSELDHLMKTKGWKYCPSTSVSRSRKPMYAHQLSARLQNPDSEGKWVQPHDSTFTVSLAPCTVLIHAISALLRAATLTFAISVGTSSSVLPWGMKSTMRSPSIIPNASYSRCPSRILVQLSMSWTPSSVHPSDAYRRGALQDGLSKCGIKNRGQ